MGPLLLGGLIGAGGGLLKSALVDAPRAERQRAVQAATTRWSPWTGMQAAAPQEADPFGSALQFGTTGAMLGQGVQTQNAQQDFNDKLLNKLGGPATGMENLSPATRSSLGIDYSGLNPNRFTSYGFGRFGA